MGEREAVDMEDEDVEDVIEAETAPKPHVRPEHDDKSGGFMARAWAVQLALDRKWDSLGKGRIARVLRMARKPEPDEFRQSSVIVLVGIAVIGGIGFLTYLLMRSLI